MLPKFKVGNSVDLENHKITLFPKSVPIARIIKFCDYATEVLRFVCVSGTCTPYEQS